MDLHTLFTHWEVIDAFTTEKADFENIIELILMKLVMFCSTKNQMSLY